MLSSNALSAPELNPNEYTSPEQGKPYRVEIKPLLPPLRTELPKIPEVMEARRNKLALPDLIDIALKNNPSTRQVWAIAQASAANWAVARGAYYPSIDGKAEGDAGKIPNALGGKSFFKPSLSLNYLLLDFGGRSANVRATKEALIQANLNHNQAIQDVLRDVPQTFFTYIGNKALVKANEASLKEARTSLESADQRRIAGAATIADVLQSRAYEQQAVYDLASSKGAVDISRGALARAVGWPANMSFDSAEEPEDIPLQKITGEANELIKVAQRERADLNAKVAKVLQKEAEIKKAKSAMFPTLKGKGIVEWQKNRSTADKGYYGGVELGVPIFEGFSLKNKVRSAKSELKAAIAELEAKEEGVISEVWTAYHNLMTAKEQLEAAKALLTSAAQSFEVSTARYKAGATDIVELMSTQSQLAKARAQLITTRMNYYNSYAELIHAVGVEANALSHHINLAGNVSGVEP